MATLYVENVPEELYSGLRKQARRNHKSIAAEVISLLERDIPTASELKRRQQFYDRMAELRSRKFDGSRDHPTSEQMIREDRQR